MSDPQPLPATCGECPHLRVSGIIIGTAQWGTTEPAPLRSYACTKAVRTIMSRNHPPDSITPPEWCPLRGGEDAPPP